jgi:toxin ParE1/3/4
MSFHILPEADQEVIEATTWYDDHALLGNEFLSEVARAYELIKQNSASLTRLETYAGSQDVRRVLLKRFPFMIVILRRDTGIVVVAVSHTRRKPNYWVKRLK